jgi:hypothetical protein
MLAQAIVTGRGRVFLNLTAERCTKLSRSLKRQRPWASKAPRAFAFCILRKKLALYVPKA